MAAHEGVSATRVVIVGAGPVGLTLAIELGRRGVRCVLVDKKVEPQFLPKMELCNSRTMEIYRRLGLTGAIRAEGYPADTPAGVYLVTTMNAPPIAHLPYPTIGEITAEIRSRNDGTLPVEAFQRVSQYTLETILRQAAEKLPAIDPRFGTTCASISQDAAGVTAELVDESGRRRTVLADYLVGCDGANSTVRDAVDIGMTGPAGIARVLQVFFRCDDFRDHHPLDVARHYLFPAPISGSIVVQSDLTHYSVHSGLPADTDPRWLIDRAVGAAVPARIVHAAPWSIHMQMATRYRSERVFLAGDAAHRFSPTSGLNMNTGVGDAADLAWKLAGVLAGWGGQGLLDSYDAERRPVGTRNRAAAEYGLLGIHAWTGAYDRGLRGAQLAGVVDREARKPYEMAGAELGYSYQNSPILAMTQGEELSPADDFARYRPIVAAGRRLPHVWLTDGTSVHDVVRTDGYTLVCVGRSAADVPTPLVDAFARTGVPLAVVPCDSPAAVAVYGAGYLLIRPDAHIAWRDSRIPRDPIGLAGRVTGNT